MASSPLQPNINQAAATYADFAPAATGRPIFDHVATYLAAAKATTRASGSQQLPDDPLELFGDDAGNKVTNLKNYYVTRPAKICKFGMRRVVIDRERGQQVTTLHFRSENALLPEVPQFHSSPAIQFAQEVVSYRAPSRPMAGIASSQLGGGTEQFKFEDEEMPLTVPGNANNSASTLPDEDQKLPDVIMSIENMDIVVKDDSHLVETSNCQVSDSFVPDTVPGIDPEADYDVESSHGSPLPDHAIFGGGSAPEQQSVAASPRIVEAPDVPEVASIIQLITPEIPTPAFAEHPLGPDGTTRVYQNYRCIKCGLASSGYLIRPSSDPADNTCNACGGRALIVRLTMPLPADNIFIPL